MAINPHHQAVNSAFKLLTSTMRDPMGSELCPTGMAIAARFIDRAISACDSLSAKIKLAKSHPDLPRAGIRFLTFKRSSQDFVTMTDRLVQCRCDLCRTRRLHGPGYRTDGRLYSDPDLIFSAMDTVIQCILLALSGLSQHKFRTGNSSDDEQPWPQGPEDLLPFGPKDSVAGLDRWLVRLPDGYIIFNLAGRLATFYAPFATEIFQYSNFTFTLARPCQHLKAIITFYHEGESSPRARDRFFTFPLSQILEFFDNLLQVDPVRYRKMIVVRGDLLKPILTSLTTIISTLPSDPLWARIRMQLNFLGIYANAELDPRTGVPLINFDIHHFEAETIDLPEQAFYLMRDTRKLGCCNLQCPSKTEVTQLRLCSRCNLVRFCGKKCQKDAWNFAPLPHKTVCGQIYSLKEALGSATWSLMLAPDFTYARFQALCRKKKVDTAVVRVIANAISAVWLSRSAIVEDLKNARITGL